MEFSFFGAGVGLERGEVVAGPAGGAAVAGPSVVVGIGHVFAAIRAVEQVGGCGVEMWRRAWALGDGLDEQDRQRGDEIGHGGKDEGLGAVVAHFTAVRPDDPAIGHALDEEGFHFTKTAMMVSITMACAIGESAAVIVSKVLNFQDSNV